jgi:23S rRNA (adenine2030-N6)-methyltransferase
MLSYQHAYHAGGPADVHKHALLAGLLALLTVKDRPLSYLESHAGRALYDLTDAAAQRTGEAARGVALLARNDDHPYARALAQTRAAHGAGAYPGSPMIARMMLRPGDAMALMELHPVEYAALATAMPRKHADAPDVAVHRRDGAEGLKALTPPRPLRGLALIDPSYELKSEYAEIAVMALQVSARWPQGVIAIWYPILPEGRHEALLGPIEAVAAVPDGGVTVLRDEVIFAERPRRGMVGSGMVLLNPPHGAAEAVQAAHRLGRRVFYPAGRTADA